MTRRGFTLIEVLIGLALSVLIVTAGLEFYARAQKAFTRLKEREEAGQAALAALDRMRIDLLHAGRGLAAEIVLGLVEAVRADAAALRLSSLERPLALSAAAAAGDTRLALASTAGIVAGQRIAVSDGTAGEIRSVAAVETGGVRLDAPLAGGYARDTASVALLELVTYFLDGPGAILRRRVNASPAQPLLERAAAALWTLDSSAPLVRIRLELDIEGAHPHEATVFLKNASLAGHL